MQKDKDKQRLKLSKRVWFAICLFGCSLALLLIAAYTNESGFLLRKVYAKQNGIQVIPRVNVPYSDAENGDIPIRERAIFWFGELNATDNFTDVRVIYNDSNLVITLHVYDRLLWYDPEPSPETLTTWDAASVFLQVKDVMNGSASTSTFKFDGQLSMLWEQNKRDLFEGAYRLEGTTWSPLPNSAFDTEIGTQMSGPNDSTADRGWHITFFIPFSTLGLDNAPPEGTIWRLGLVTHDRDGQELPHLHTSWPENMFVEEPSSWGELRFGLARYVTSLAVPSGSAVIKQGVNGKTVTDSHVGGGMVCGSDLEAGGSSWPEWGNYNRGGTTGANVQNQWNLADWPCFSKYYVTFPLDDIPPGQRIISATLTLHQFGNSGQDETLPSQPQASLIQVLTVAEEWDEDTITWNNAPSAVQNVSQTFVNPVPPHSERSYDHIGRHWDVRFAVAQAYATGQPLRLVLYSADGAKNSGKYFRTSEFHDVAARPTLKIVWGYAVHDPQLALFPVLIRN